MDSYEILGVTRDSSDKEIEIAYEDLKRKYDPDFNTSIRAYTKYREIIKAYKDIKNDASRKLYDLKDDKEIISTISKEYKLFDYNSVNEKKNEEIINYDSLEEVKELVKEDVILNKKISYLYYLLNLRVDIIYCRFVNCDKCSSFTSCPQCDGVGVVYYKENQVYCPKCHGKGKVSQGCEKCFDEGVYKKEEKYSFFVDNETMTFNDLGDEYYDGTKSNLVVNFDFYDRDNINIKDDEIHVNYYLSKDETLNGINREFYSESGVFKLEVSSFVSNGLKKEVVFNNKKIIFTFYNDSINGSDMVYYLFINKKYKGNIIYFNEDYSKCSVNKSEEYINEVELNEKIVLSSFGESGSYGGVNGDLIIKCFFNNQKDLSYISEVKELSTSKMFNLLGGKIEDVRHYGFKGSNCLIKNDDKYYLLSGDNNDKLKLKDYFVFKVLCLFLWVIIPVLALIIPYSVMMFVILFIVMGAYLLLINALMEVKV